MRLNGPPYPHHCGLSKFHIHIDEPVSNSDPISAGCATACQTCSRMFNCYRFVKERNPKRILSHTFSRGFIVPSTSLDEHCDVYNSPDRYRAQLPSISPTSLFLRCAQRCLASSKSGAPWVSWHTFRRIHATLLQLAGGSAKDAQAQLGHSQITTTLGIYTIPVPAHQREAVEKPGACAPKRCVRAAKAVDGMKIRRA